MTTYVLREDGNGRFHLVEKHLATPAGVKTPFVMTDSMDPTVHPSNGKVYDSKSRFRQETKARGLVEVGNEYRAMTERAPVQRDPVAADVARAYDMVMAQRRR